MIIFYNPHVDDFLAEPIHFRLLKRRPLKKYGFFIEEARLSGDQVNVLVDATASALIPEKYFRLLPKFLCKAVSFFEILLWRKINGFGNELNIVEIRKDHADDTLVAFSYKAATGHFSSRVETFGRFKAVVFHLSHYFTSTLEKSENIRALPNAYLAGDSDITENFYFKRFFYWYEKKFLVLPFAINKRFTNQIPLPDRVRKAVATGSFHDLQLERPAHKYADYMSATSYATYHPVRLSLYQAAEKYKPWIDCQVSPYRDYGKSVIGRLLSHFAVSQKKYFAINIVDLYNRYCFAVVGEELSGFPALGAFEAIACGCVLVAQKDYYKGTNLLPQRNFIPYDGSVDMLANVVSTVDEETILTIYNNNKKFIENKYSYHAVYQIWTETLNKI